MRTISRAERIELIKRVAEIQEQLEYVMGILIPEEALDAEGNCTHPEHLVEDLSTMGESKYRCACGAEQSTPFVAVSS